ncbi:polysaccharide biosynthesis protein [Paenalkalicoccus suaedae]|uniref:Polysaccharide biosynthesis protein n=1 Tax=Paenalkalicoccus suaedae TaxID=2592382 RepID=A0A859FH19_9BACI|nr:polysaccharide biosynthesis protein [Paenalkalicoccus suaedae]QKS72118.1 polysaccharide biosynthesis protein [Paenalkalicoccus suaedae]
MSEQQLIRGTMILSMGIFITKILGLIYVFPFTALVGQQGLALYTYGYTPYTVLLSVATLGVPLAVSKFVSKYNALGDYHTGQRLLKSGLIFMSISGFIAFLLLFSLAEPIANRVLDADDLSGNTISDAVFVIRMVSAALIVVPVMAIIRGYFQGHNSMGPTAVSQVIEQVIRIAFILLLTWIILYQFEGSLGTAVGFATFGAFVGAIGGLVVLLYYYKKRMPSLQEQVKESAVDHKLPLSTMYKELIRYALPLSFVGLAIPLYQMVDLFTFNHAMITRAGFEAVEAERYFGAFQQASHKLIMIPVSIATAMSLTILPTVTKAHTMNDTDRLQRTVTQTYQIIVFLTVPAAIGLMLVATPAYAALFGFDGLQIGAEVLRAYAPAAILFSVFAVTASLLQGINKQYYAILALVAGLAFKLLTNSLFIGWFGPEGAILATTIGYAVAVFVNAYAIGKFTNYNYKQIGKRFVVVAAFTLLMGAVVAFLTYGLTETLTLDTRMNAFIVLLLAVGAGGIVYMNLAIRSGLAGIVLGERFAVLKKR